MAKLAEGAVEEALLAVLPPGVPPQFRSIIAVEMKGRGDRAIYTAKVEMFDGEVGVVRLSRWRYGLSQKWISLPGGAFRARAGEPQRKVA